MGRVASAAGNTLLGLALVGFVLLGALILKGALVSAAINRGAPPVAITDRNPPLPWDPAPLTLEAPSSSFFLPSAVEVAGTTVETDAPSVAQSAGSTTAAPQPSLVAEPEAARGSQSGPTSAGRPPSSAPAAARSTSDGPPSPSRAITRVLIPSIGIDSRVALAKYVSGGGGTWQIPPYIVGHAEFTAGAGEIGNTLLFGHVSSLSVGNVFETLDRARLGDLVAIYTDDAEYRYRVVDIRAVSRDDLSLLGPTINASASLITCTGNWLPLERDYDQRLIVRAELIGS